MMDRILPATIAIFWLCSFDPSFAATRLKFGRLAVEDGLSNNWVQAVHRDSHGFLWIGTHDGLNRYDGRSFIHYRHSREDSHSLPGPQVSVIYEDSRQRLWLGSGWEQGGLALYDRAMDRFIRVPLSPESGGATSRRVFDIIEDRRGRLWVGTENGIELVDPDKGLVTRYDVVGRVGRGQPRSASSTVFAILQDDHDGFWVGTFSGLFRFDSRRGKSDHWSDRAGESTGLDREVVGSLLRDIEGDVWIGTFGRGVCRLNPQSRQVTQYLPRVGDPTSISHRRILNLAADKEGRIWIGTDNGGLNVFDRRSGRFQRYAPDPDDEESLNAWSIHALHVDDQKIVWIGTYDGGLNFVSPFGQGFSHVKARRDSLNDPHVISLLEDRAGNLWIGTDGGGLNRKDARTGRYRYYRHDPRDDRTIAANNVNALHEDSAGMIWLGGWAAGLGRLDPRTGRVTRYRRHPRNPKTIVSDFVWKILELRSGELLIATQGGADLLDRKTAVCTRLWKRYPDLGRGSIFSAVEDRHGNLWLGGSNRAQYFNLAERKTTTYRHDPKDPEGLGRGVVSTIFIDSRENVWLGTETGLNCLPATTRRMRRYTIDNGLPHETVTNIIEDASGNLWLTTNRGLSKFVNAVNEPEQTRFLNFDVHDGLQGLGFARGTALRSRDGRLYFGGPHGLNSFFPSEIVTNHVPPPLVLTDLKIFNRSVVPGAPGSPLDRSIANTDELTLSYKHTVVTFEFAALNLALPQKNRYMYMLEGLDPAWNEVSAQNTATYTQLLPGRYTFRVRASNNDDIWNEEGVALRLRVTPPFWRTPWFQILIAAALITALAAVYRRRVRRIQAYARDLAAKIDERTRDLHRLNEELEERVTDRTSELEEEKERLAVTLRSIGDGVIATDVKGRVVLMNRVAEMLTGWALSEAEGRPLKEVFPAVDRENRTPQPDSVRAVLNGQSTLNLPSESLLIRRDGSEVLVTDSVAPIRDRESRVVGVVLVFRDVTERRRVEEQLQTAQKLEALGILAGGIAHDFNNLLTGVFGYIDLAHRRSDDPDKARDSLSKALSVLQKTRGLTGQLLTFSRAGQPVVAPFALPELLRSSARFALSGSNVGCEMEIPEDLWSCQGDEQQIDQVIDNLLLNARQSMPQGGTIRIRAKNLVVPDDAAIPVKDGRYIRLTIRDEGTGVPPELRARIFEPFFTTKASGSGLGLTTSYSIVRKHGGHIDLESRPGKGTSFSVYLPASTDPARAARSSTTEMIKGQGRILLLDDEEYVRDVANEALGDLGYAVEAVSTGEEAVDAYRKAHDSSLPFDLVILDLTIPGGMGGAAVLSRLQAIDPSVRAVASSGYSGDPVMANPEAYGFLARLTKPYTAIELSDILAHAFRGQKR
ncbi:MAG: PAS domain S-box protein [Vicinamibacteria bacterium]|nr:PAS domain S-box protein [Vicinamibacteria bacterium]